MNYMAMAGWKTEDMLSGIEGIMNLAAASGEDLATTSDIVTDALTAFGLSADDSGHFADLLAAASSNANTNVSRMYNDLLESEQALITGYDELIEGLDSISPNEAAVIGVAKEEREHLENPSSMEILDAAVSTVDEGVAVKLVYKSDNSQGGSEERTYYYLMSAPEYDENNEQWSCLTDEVFQLFYTTELITVGKQYSVDKSSSQKHAFEKFESGTQEKIDPQKIMDNLDLNIVIETPVLG